MQLCESELRFCELTRKLVLGPRVTVIFILYKVNSLLNLRIRVDGEKLYVIMGFKKEADQSL